MSKRQILRERRRRRQLRQRLAIIAMVVVGALLVAFALIYPSIKPVGNIIMITPRANNAPVEMNTMGDPGAPVLVEVWEDFHCGGCKYYSETIEPLIIQNYVETGKALYVFRHFPFLASESYQAASASMCAGEQGRFWDYHDMLFANAGEQDAFGDNRLIAYAKALDLNVADFRLCLGDDRYAEQINLDKEELDARGSAAAPAIFLNSQPVYSSTNPERGIPTYEDIARAIETALAGQ